MRRPHRLRLPQPRGSTPPATVGLHPPITANAARASAGFCQGTSGALDLRSDEMPIQINMFGVGSRNWDIGAGARVGRSRATDSVHNVGTI